MAPAYLLVEAGWLAKPWCDCESWRHRRARTPCARRGGRDLRLHGSTINTCKHHYE